MTFDELQLSETLLKAISAEGYTRPTPIQEQAIPAILNKKDVLGCAQTGTGKTAAFALPVLQLMAQKDLPRSRKHDVRALILVPTRELAIQVAESFETYGKGLHFKTVAIYGGVSINGQNTQLRGGTDILIATPGRLIDMVKQRLMSLKKVDILVLDEADRMFDMGFVHDIKKIIALLTSRKQTLLFSATLHAEVNNLAKTILRNPVNIEISPAASTAEKIDQKVYFLEKKDKPALLLHILKNKQVRPVLVFTKTKNGADQLVELLAKNKIQADALHSDKGQVTRERTLVKFKNNNLRVLVATDIAARGLDIEELKYVINFDIPHIPENYVHRIGRTGRADNEGFAYSFCEPDELDALKAIQTLINESLDVADHPYQISFKAFEKPVFEEKAVKLIPPSSARKKSATKPKKFYRPFKK